MSRYGVKPLGLSSRPASTFDIKGGGKILETAREAVNNFEAHAVTAGLPPEVTDRITRILKSIK